MFQSAQEPAPELNKCRGHRSHRTAAGVCATTALPSGLTPAGAAAAPAVDPSPPSSAPHRSGTVLPELSARRSPGRHPGRLAAPTVGRHGRRQICAAISHRHKDHLVGVVRIEDDRTERRPLALAAAAVPDTTRGILRFTTVRAPWAAAIWPQVNHCPRIARPEASFTCPMSDQLAAAPRLLCLWVGL
jgi:hypothetical protein